MVDVRLEIKQHGHARSPSTTGNGLYSSRAVSRFPASDSVMLPSTGAAAAESAAEEVDKSFPHDFKKENDDAVHMSRKLSTVGCSLASNFFFTTPQSSRVVFNTDHCGTEECEVAGAAADPCMIVPFSLFRHILTPPCRFCPPTI